MRKSYTDERNVQILISLMKEHNIKRVIASPGGTNVTFVASIQSDPFFEIYSSVDERSAAYIACGLAAETGEPVAISCTGATASRNYLPGLTEAYYRKLPILAITSTQHTGLIGQNVAQMVDRSVIQKDIALVSIQAPMIHSDEDERACVTAMNNALLELHHRGGGPVHINLATTYSKKFPLKELPPVRTIRRLGRQDTFPVIEEEKILIFVGAHQKWTDELQNAVDKFCSLYNGAVLCDHTSNYQGKFKVLGSLMCDQTQYEAQCRYVNTMIHIGEISGAYIGIRAKEVWRVSIDGAVRDTYGKLKYVFEMEEEEFFHKYATMKKDNSLNSTSYYQEWIQTIQKVNGEIPESLPFSNPWMAQQTAPRLPKECVLHLGILNSLRSWNFFELDSSIRCYANTGGFGTDGGVSSLVGASFADRKKLYFGVTGDLAFFYDMNALGNRSIGPNLRIVVVNNGCGAEFRNYGHQWSVLGEYADDYVSAAGHFGNKSRDLLRHYAQDLGFEYLSANNKEEYLVALDRFVTPEITDKPMLLEAFTDGQGESDALKILRNLEVSTAGIAKNMTKQFLGDKGIKTVKKMLGR